MALYDGTYMGFRELSLSDTYDSDEDDVLNKFYVPVLNHAQSYDRLAGYFSSTALAASAKGMAQFIMNGGKMRLVTCVQLTERDVNAIRDGLSNPESIISKIILDDLEAIEEQLQSDYVNALAWMIADGRLEIKIAVPLAGDGAYNTMELDSNSIYHQKIGILRDEKGDVITFSGSVNETGKAWTSNIEEFKIFCSWKSGQDVYGASDNKKFEKFWYGQSKNTKIFDLPTAIRKRLIQNAPESAKAAVNLIRIASDENVELRDYQNAAIKAWFDNGMHGVLEMATGTGKTITAISCIKKILTDKNQHLVVIACPYTHLIKQWIDELKKQGIKSVPAYDNSLLWQRDLESTMIHLNDGVEKHLVIVTTHATFSGSTFMEMISHCKVNSLLIMDEVHKIGSEQRTQGLLDSYEHRMGLSATPERYFDEEGTKKILDYFGGVVFKFGLDDAIRGGYLSHYLLFPHKVYMTDSELIAYNKFSKNIAIEYSQEYPDHNKIRTLTLKRAKIVKRASNKIDVFKKVLESITEDIDHCLVYCIDKQIDDAATVLHQRGILYHRFTFKEETDERNKLLSEFAKGDIGILLAIKCLDEGVDVPATKTAIILASSRNPVEFIQRRGRILRPYKGKDRAIIHDLIVLPPPGHSNRIYTDAEKTEIRNELDRMKEFASSSDNPEVSQDLIRMLKAEYKLE